ncbi:MAG: DNA polymerase IV [Candidatus Altiarchaeota archaeon]
MAERIVLLLDMDYFYAQVEERENPDLKGKSVIVCMVSAREGSLGAIAACNYPARRLGLHSGMPCSLARKKAPEGVYLPARRGFYSLVSDSIMDELKTRCDVLEQVSIDEAYMDVSTKTDYTGIEEFIISVKAAVMERERLTCSIGAGPNKLVAKMAASVNKPDGYRIIPPENALEFVTSLPVSKLHGVGGKTLERLTGLGIATMSDLQKMSINALESEFGPSRGRMLYDGCRGMDESPVTEREKEQYGRLASARSDTRDESELAAIIDALCGDIHGRIMKSGKEYRTVSSVFVLEDMQMRTRSRTLPAPTQSRDVLAETSKALLREFLSEYASRIRRIGVVASNLGGSGGQKTLADY